MGFVKLRITKKAKIESGLERLIICRGVPGVGSNPAGDTRIFSNILNFSLPSSSLQLMGAHANEIKHDHSPVVIVVLDLRYELSYKAYAYIMLQYSFKFKPNDINTDEYTF